MRPRLSERPARRQVKVDAVEPNSPAAAAGFKPGDVIERVDNIAVFTSIDVERALLDKRPESKAAVAVGRGNDKESLTLSFEQAVVKPMTPAETAWKRLGIKVGETTEDGLITLLETGECVAACDGAPAIQVNLEYCGNVTNERADAIIEAIRNGEDAKTIGDRFGIPPVKAG